VTAPARPRRPGAPGVLPAAPKLAERARTERSGRRRRRLRTVGVALLWLLPLAGLAWVLLASPWLAVASVEVTGNGRLTAEQVVEAAAVEPGTPLASLDVGDVQERVRALAPVADVRVGRGWPSTLRVEVTERVAVAAVPRRDAVQLVDEDGVVFATEPTAPAGVPTLELERPARDDPATRAALAVRAELPDELATQVGVVRATTPDDVELVLTDGRTVVWGAPGRADTKAPALAALLRMPGTVYDVSAPGVVVRR
jgi:cell division protein FtsQ